MNGARYQLVYLSGPDGPEPEVTCTDRAVSMLGVPVGV